MAQVSIKQSSFKDKMTGEKIEYNRLIIDGFLQGKRRVAEFKIEGKNDIMLAELLLNSDEVSADVVNAKATDQPSVTVTPDNDFLYEFEE